MEAQKPNTPQKPVAKKKEPEHKVRGIKNAIWVIVCCAVVAVNAFIFVFGNDANFDNVAFQQGVGCLGGTMRDKDYVVRRHIVFLHHLAYTLLGLFTDHWTVVYHS